MKTRNPSLRGKSRITRGSGNVFNDLGFSQRQARELYLKAELTRQIYNRIKALELTQIQAAARLRISQPDVSKLMNGRYSGYSVERLLALLSALEMDVDILVRPRANSPEHRPGIVRVLEVA